MQVLCLAALAAALPAVVSAGLLRPVQEPAAREVPQERVLTVEEEETGIEFPVWLDLALPAAEGADAARTVRHHLLGTGVREKTIFKVNVYGMAMYADRAALGAALRDAAQDIPARSAANDKRLAAALLEGRFGVSMRWVMARDVEDEDVREAFEDWLGPRLKAAVEATPGADREAARRHADEAMATFRGFFSADLEEGDELRFAWLPGGELHSWIRGEANPVVKSEMLSRALWDCYVGPDAAEPKARRAFLSGLWRLARQWKAPAADKESSNE